MDPERWLDRRGFRGADGDPAPLADALRRRGTSTSDLGLMASAILQGVLHLLAEDGRVPEEIAEGRPCLRPVSGADGELAWQRRDVTPVEPMAEVLAAR